MASHTRSAFVTLLALFARGVSAAGLRPKGSSQLHPAASEYTIWLQNHQNVQYTGPLTIGGQEVPVIYDTGSFEILVLSTLCARCTGGDAVVYDHTKSHDYIGTPTMSEHLFGSGPVLSEKGFDEVKVGTLGSPFEVRDQSFWQVLDHDVAIWTNDAQFSGIVGMTHLTRIPDGYTADPIPETSLMQALGLDSFAFCLLRGARFAPGKMVLAPQVVPGLYQSIPVEGHAHWGMRVTGFGAPGLGVANPCSPSCGAIVDSGTSLIAVPPSAEKVVEALSRRIAADCSNIHELPVLRLEFGSVVVELPPQAYVMQVLNVELTNKPIWEAVLPWAGPTFEPTKTCMAAFMKLSERKTHLGPMYIFGMPFLRYFYTVFDRTNKAVHVTKATPSCDPVGGAYSFVANHTNATPTDNDYQPMQIDLNSAIAPRWAFDKGILPDFDL